MLAFEQRPVELGRDTRLEAASGHGDREGVLRVGPAASAGLYRPMARENALRRLGLARRLRNEKKDTGALPIKQVAP